MRITLRTALMATVLAGGLPALVDPPTAVAQDAAGQQKAPKQVNLTQGEIDHLVATQKDLRGAQTGTPDKPDPKAEAKVASAVKAHGFSSLDDYADVSFSVGLVLAGLDPETKAYVGPTTVLKKQIAELQADKSMPAKEKSETLAELNEALKQGDSDKPLPGNVDLVKANFDKLTQAMQQND